PGVGDGQGGLTQLLLYFKFFIKFMETFFLSLYKKLHDTINFASWPAKLKIFPIKIILLYKKNCQPLAQNKEAGIWSLKKRKKFIKDIVISMLLILHSVNYNTNWASGEDDHVVARAEYDFVAVSEEEISFRAGDMLNLALKEQQPRVRGWLLASLDGQTTGLIPANYVKILGKRRGRKTVESSKISKQQQSFTNTTLIKGATAADSLDEQEAAFESVFVETNKVPVASDSTGKNGDKQDL
ncbi:hypothetical protein FD755_023183, partial [Muntiacus reevesi]